MGTYQDPLDEAGWIENRLGYHPATPDTAPVHAGIRDAAIEFAKTLVYAVPPCPERTLMFRHIQYAMMLANASVAVELGGPVPDDPGRVHEQGKPTTN